jgi:hypothetical protein
LSREGPGARIELQSEYVLRQADHQSPNVRDADAMLWPDSTSRTASCLNSNVYRARVDLIIAFPFADCQLWDTFRGGKINQLLARHNPVSIREMVRRGKAAAREHDVRRTETFERKRAEAARNGATAICNWLIEIGLTGPSCEQIIEEVRREFAQREQDGSLPPPPARHRLAIKELIQRSKPKSPIPDDAASISWYHQWLFRWTFCAFPDAFVKDEALDIALQQQWMR